jgi:hypothetical protein
VNIVASAQPGQGVPGELLVVAVQEQELGRLRAEGKSEELTTIFKTLLTSKKKSEAIACARRY